jgi:hypothetical protein
MASPQESYRYWKERLRLDPTNNRVLRMFLIAKGRLGRYDDRMLKYFGVPPVPNEQVRSFFARAYGAGLVPTATTNGQHSAHSLHYQGRAGDVGLRSDEIGTPKGLHKMEKFQDAEFKRARQVGGYTELIGPINNEVILSGVVSPLAEGTPLENQHDNHVHGGF